jgi:hypothetical protein
LGNVITTQLDPTTFAINFNNGDYAGNIVVNAVPFGIYVADNPSDYKLEQYNGISIAAAPQLGFSSILINITATETV